MLWCKSMHRKYLLWSIYGISVKSKNRLWKSHKVHTKFVLVHRIVYTSSCTNTKHTESTESIRIHWRLSGCVGYVLSFQPLVIISSHNGPPYNHVYGSESFCQGQVLFGALQLLFVCKILLFCAKGFYGFVYIFLNAFVFMCFTVSTTIVSRAEQSKSKALRDFERNQTHEPQKWMCFKNVNFQITTKMRWHVDFYT